MPGLSVAAGMGVVICLAGVDLTCDRAADDMVMVVCGKTAPRRRLTGGAGG